MRILLTGATGFLGAHLVDALLDRGHAVRAYARRSSDTRAIAAMGVEVARGALDDGAALLAALRDVDAVIHAAGGGMALDPRDVDRANTASTETLADAAIEAGVRRFVLVSSLAAHGPSAPDAPAREDQPDAPRSRYGESKRAAEQRLIARADRLAVSLIRPPALYGPGEARMVPLFRLAERGLAPTVHPDGTLSLLHGADCADAIALAAEREAGTGILYVAEPEPYTRREMAAHIGRAVGRRVRLVPLPPVAVALAGRIGDRVARLRGRPAVLSRDKTRDVLQAHQACDPGRALATLGWRARRRFPEGAVEAYLDYQRRGWI